MYYVTMIDNFMSGWGKAQGKLNVYCVECETQLQAEQIKNAAITREEMSNIKIRKTAPKNNHYTLVSLKKFSELGAVWTGDLKNEN